MSRPWPKAPAWENLTEESPIPDSNIGILAKEEKEEEEKNEERENLNEERNKTVEIQ